MARLGFPSQGLRLSDFRLVWLQSFSKWAALSPNTPTTAWYCPLSEASFPNGEEPTGQSFAKGGGAPLWSYLRQGQTLEVGNYGKRSLATEYTSLAGASCLSTKGTFWSTANRLMDYFRRSTTKAFSMASMVQSFILKTAVSR
jgi:hypothetical protein